MPVFVFRSFVALAVVASMMLFAAPAAASPATRRAGDVVYAPPVDAPISDPFRLPSTPYGPGNRGLEYATSAGVSVAAAADGTVVFAGVVAGHQWVTIKHADGVRTTYGPLSAIKVTAGQVVHRGEAIGATAGALTFTARVGSAYIDPATLFGGGPPRVHLIPEPLDQPGVRGPGGGGWSLPGSDAVLSALDWERRHVQAVPSLVVSLTPAPAVFSAVRALGEWHHDQGQCTNSTVAPPLPQQRRFAVLVGGIGSSSQSASIDDVDTSALGYRPGDVLRFSYNGGRVPSSTSSAGELANLTESEYGPRDTVGDLRVAGQRLAQLLEQVVASAPAGLPVDVIAHSQGGLVVRLALADLEVTNPEALARLGVVVTIGTPHHGTELAELASASAANPLDALLVDAGQSISRYPVSPNDVAVAQMTPGSDLLAELAATPLPPGLRVVSIAGRGDVIVPSPRSQLEGATNVTVSADGASVHDRLPGSAAVTREIGLAIADMGPTCVSAADAMIDAASGTLVGNFEHAAAVTQGA
jgi:Peptidase family M23/Putative serine esterase (DUF676)